MNVEIKQMPALRVAAARHVGPYETISEAFVRLNEIVTRARLEGSALIGLYHDDAATTPAARMRSDAGVVVSDSAQLPDGLTEVRVPGGRYAHTMHTGPYEKLGDVWHTLRDRLAREKQKMGSGPSYEIYRNTPADVPKEKLETELYVPLAD